MRKPRSLALALVVAAASAGPALAQNDMGGGQHTMPMGDEAAGSGKAMRSGKTSGADAEFQQGMMTMQRQMGMKMTGDPDRDFVMMMIPHHQGAIDMAKVELKYGKDPELRKLAQDIVKAQEEEISTMRGWQKKSN